jgi:sec-independent protein translocase protein TatA
MGLGGVSIGSLLLIFLIVLVLFGTKKLRNIGEDLGQAVRSFRKGLQEVEDQNHSNKPNNDPS